MQKYHLDFFSEIPARMVGETLVEVPERIPVWILGGVSRGISRGIIEEIPEGITGTILE